jgi:hypothetical protein
VSSEERLTPSSLNCTPETPTLSEAEAERVTVPVTIEPGEVSVIVGRVVSPVGTAVNVVNVELVEVPVFPDASFETIA